MLHRDLSLDDPLLAPYTRLKDRELAREGDRFIAEGRLVVERLLASKFACESVLVREQLADELSLKVPESVPVYVLGDRQIDQMVGYKFHNGALAVGVRRPSPTLDDVIHAAARLVIVAPDLNSTENLGAVIRIAAGFGASALVIGPNSCDPFYRQSLRVSMGAAFSLPIVRSSDVTNDLVRLRRDFGFDTLASVLRNDAISLDQYTPGGRVAIVLGSEAHGLSEVQIDACSHKLMIPMHLGTDSLNVSIACAVFAWHVRHTAGTCQAVVRSDTAGIR